MPRRYPNERSAHIPFPRQLMRTRSEASTELGRSCGGFKSPKSTEEKLASFIAATLAPLGVECGTESFLSEGTPLNWQYLLRYLYRNGIISKPQFIFGGQYNDRPRLLNAQLSLQQSADISDGRLRAGTGFGAALNTEEMMSKTVGEALERYFLSKYKRETMIKASYNKIKNAKLPRMKLEDLNGFLPWQRDLHPTLSPSYDEELRWVKGEAYPSGEKVLLPAQLVFWDYRHEEEKMILQTTTSGCAGHFSKRQAILSGLLENIERDGFLIYWLNKLSPRIIDTEKIHDPEFKSFMSYLARYRLEVTFLNTSTDILVPSVTCVVIDRASADGPIISIGGGTGFNLKDILIHSAIEAILINSFISRKEFIIPDDYAPFSDAAIARTERLAAWKGLEAEKRFRFFLSGERQSPEEFLGEATGVDTTEKQLSYVLKRLRTLGKGYEIYVYEVQSKVLDALGYSVVRTIVPQLIPLYLAEHAAPLDSRRLKEVPAKLGYAAATTLNPWPHPFP